MKLYYLIHAMLAQKAANVIKIVSVGIGLLVSSLIFSRLAYNYSFDTCFKDYDNIYQIWMLYEINGEKKGPYPALPGRVGGGVLEELESELSGAAVICRALDGTLYNGDNRVDIPKISSDSLFFTTMGIDVLSGNPLHDLTLPDVIYLSESVARSLYGDTIPEGAMLRYNENLMLKVKGVFRDISDNITLPPFKAVISMPTAFNLGQDRRFWWSGGDSWLSYIRKRPDSDISLEEMNRRANLMYQRHSPDTEAISTTINIAPLRDTYLGYDDVKRMNPVLWVLGFALLLITTLNYVLLTIASMSRRSKGIGIHKCSGADGMTITAMFLGETLVVVLGAVLCMLGLLFLFQPLIEDTLSLTPSQILAPERLWVIGSVLLFFFAVGGLLPGRLMAKIPVTQVFRRFTERNAAWKRILLFIQVGGVAFIGGLLMVVSAQYSEVLNSDKGFSVERIVVIDVPGRLHDELIRTPVMSLPYVEDFSAAYHNPLSSYSGDYIYDDKGEVLFNTRIDWSSENHLALLGVSILHGRSAAKEDEFVINQEFARRMNWPEDEAVGKIMPWTSFGEGMKVVGVIKDFAIGGCTHQVDPVVQAYAEYFYGNGYVKLKEPFEQNFKSFKEFLANSFPEYEFNAYSMSRQAEEVYADVKMFRNSVLIATVALLFISLMGLIGFSRDEVERRRKEIAVRKVNGASVVSVLELLCGNVLKITLPAVVIGTACAWYAGALWIEAFTVKAPNIMLGYCLSALVILVCIILCVICVAWRAATDNPVNQLKSE